MTTNKVLLNLDHFIKREKRHSLSFNTSKNSRARCIISAKCKYAQHLMSIHEPTYLLVKDILDFPEEFSVELDPIYKDFKDIWSRNFSTEWNVIHPNKSTVISIAVESHQCEVNMKNIHYYKFSLFTESKLNFLNTHERLEIEEALKISSKRLHDKIEDEKVLQKERNAEKERRQVQADLLEWHKSKQES